MAAELLSRPGQKFLGAIAPNGDTYMYGDRANGFYYKNNQKVSTDIFVYRIKVIKENVFVMGRFTGYPFATIFYVNGKRMEVSTEYSEMVSDVINGPNGFIVLGTDHYWVNKPGTENAQGATPENYGCYPLQATLEGGNASIGHRPTSGGWDSIYVSHLSYYQQASMDLAIQIDHYKGHIGNYPTSTYFGFREFHKELIDRNKLAPNAFFDVSCDGGLLGVLSGTNVCKFFDYETLDLLADVENKNMNQFTGKVEVLTSNIKKGISCYIGTGVDGRGIVQIDGVDTLLPISNTSQWILPLAVAVQ